MEWNNHQQGRTMKERVRERLVAGGERKERGKERSLMTERICRVESASHERRRSLHCTDHHAAAAGATVITRPPLSLLPPHHLLLSSRGDAYSLTSHPPADSEVARGGQSL